MYITDVNHFLDDKGAIAPLQGPARATADFLACVIAYASDFGSTGILAARCFKCKKGTVESAIAQDDAIYWSCKRCKAEGRISNWQAKRWSVAPSSAYSCSAAGCGRAC